MSAKWPRAIISDVCDLIVDCVNKTAPRVDHETPYKMIRTPNVRHGLIDLTDCRFVERETYEKWTRRAKVERGDVLLTREAPMGEVGLVDFDDTVFLGQRIMQYRADKTVLHPRFLLYSFLSTDLQNQFRMHDGTGSVVSHIRVPDCSKFELKLPPLSEQNRIVNILGSLDDKIQLNHQINQTLEQMARAIFKSWFVDFEPVKAKIAALAACGSEEDAVLAAMQAISGNGEEELTRLQTEQPEQYAELRATAELFPSAMQDSELGEIPEGWSVSQIGDEVTAVGGGTPSTKNPAFWEAGQISWTSPKDLSNLADRVLVETERKITEAGLAKISSGLLPIDTVLMSSRAPVGYLALAKIPVAVNQGYIAMKCEKTLTPAFVIQWCQSHMGEIKSRASGTTFAEISKKNFKIIPVVTPAESLISIYSRQASSLYDAIENNLRESDTLAKLRDSLLPKLLTGELSISGAEDHVQETAEIADV
ncbi:MAG: restriction endonuclease subunit S [Marinobacter sp.]|uniref:restriction endonuclease subunit S n=1 Tax=Marinobacter sp. TaxID=50741 RepID=UPI003299D3AC